MAADRRRGVGVEVVGVPDFMSADADRTVDKLLIHFLRPRNGGGEVRRVLYPTRVPGQALVLYEEPDVASRVLQQRHHLLEVGDQTFPLEVKPADRPQLDLPVEATLNVSLMADQTALTRLLHLHGFEVVGRVGHTHLRVKGSMMMLRSFKAEAEKLLSAQATPHLTRPSSSSSSSSGQGRPSPPPPGAVSKNSTHGSSVQATRTPLRSTHPPAYGSPPPTPTSSTTSSSSPIGPVDGRHHPPPVQTPVESFIVASDVVLYARHYKKNDIADVLASHGVEMDVVAMDTELSSVAVKGRHASVAAEKLRGLLNDLNTVLHFRKVPLDDLDRRAREGVAQRVEALRHTYPMVLIRPMDEVIHLIGPRWSCEGLKERLLLERLADSPAPLRAGRSQEKEPNRRSRSVPRNASRRGEPAGEATAKPAQPSSLDGGYFPPRGGGEGGQGAALTREGRGQRERSGSVTRTSVKPEETANHGSTERTNSRPVTGPVLKNSLMPNFNTKRITKYFKN